MKRFAVPLVIAGSLAVLIALVVLLRSITAETTGEPAVTATPPRSTEPTGITGPAPTVETGVPAWKPQARPKIETSSTPSAPSTSGGDSWAAGGVGNSDAPPGTKLNTKNLHFGLPALREKIAANTPKLAACMGGKRPTANVTMTFIVGQKAGKVEVEQVDIDGDKTTLTDESLLECMSNATKSIQLDGLPREAPAILVTRETAIEDGQVTADKPLKFSYIR